MIMVEDLGVLQEQMKSSARSTRRYAAHVNIAAGRLVMTATRQDTTRTGRIPRRESGKYLPHSKPRSRIMGSLRQEDSRTTRRTMRRRTATPRQA
jgi:hypothetical protein